MIIQPALHLWCIEQTLGKVIFLGIKKTRRSIYQYLPAVFPHCFFWSWALRVFVPVQISQHSCSRILWNCLAVIFRRLVSLIRLVTRFSNRNTQRIDCHCKVVHSPQYWESFVDQTKCALGHERVVDDKNPFFDTTGMIKKDHRVPVQASGDEWQLLSRIPPSTDDTSIIVFVEFSYILCCCVYFSVLWDKKDGTSRPKKKLMLTHQSLINDKSNFPYKKGRHRGLVLLPEPEKFYIAWWHNWNTLIWLNWGAIGWLKRNEPWFKNWLTIISRMLD